MDEGLFASASYAPADFGDAEDARPLGASFDIGGNGSSTPYSSAVTAMASKQIDEVRIKAENAINLQMKWRKRFRDFISIKNSELLDFLKSSAPSHPVMGPSEILLRRFGNPQVTASHSSVRDIIMDASGGTHIEAIDMAIDEIKRNDTGLKGHAAATQYLYEEYRLAGEIIMKQQSALKIKLDKLDRIQGRITNILDLDANQHYAPLMEASEEYLRNVFDDNQIESEYKALIEAYRRFAALRDAIQTLRAPSSIENEPLCSICLTDTVSYAMSPCGHTFCQNCSRRQMGNCPICRATVRDKLKLYFS